MPSPSIVNYLYSQCRLTLVALLVFWIASPIKAQSFGIRAGAQVFGSFNASGVGPMVGLAWKRHEIGVSINWLEVTTKGIMPHYRFLIGSESHRTCAFLQLLVPVVRNEALISTFVQTPNGGIETKYAGLTTGIHFAIGADIQLWKNLKLTTSAGLGHNWIHYIDFPYPSYDYDLSTSSFQVGLTYRIPFRKEIAPTPLLESETDPDLWVGLQAESVRPVIYATVTNPGATYFHPYAEARLTPHMRLRASAWIGPQTVIDGDTSTRWGVRGFGLATRFYSMQLRRLQFFHTIGIELVPRRFSPLHHTNLLLANGFSYDIAHRVNLEAGMNLHINTDDYYMSPFFGVAVPFSFRKKVE